MPRAKPCTSTEAVVETRALLNEGIQSPIKLNQHQNSIFQDVLKCRPASTWTAGDLRMAANLARMQATLDKALDDLEREGYLRVTASGDEKLSPRVDAVAKLAATIQALSRNIGTSAAQRRVTGVVAGPKWEAQAEIEGELHNTEDPGFA